MKFQVQFTHCQIGKDVWLGYPMAMLTKKINNNNNVKIQIVDLLNYSNVLFVM